jgi:hypothetical protein
MVQDIANNLLTKRGRKPVSKHWVDNFKTRTPEIKLKRSCLYNYQQALNKDARVITPWFELVANTKAKYSIADNNMYNFNKIGFIMGVIQGQIVFTGSKKQGNSKRVRPSNCR